MSYLECQRNKLYKITSEVAGTKYVAGPFGWEEAIKKWREIVLEEHQHDEYSLCSDIEPNNIELINHQGVIL